MKPTSQRSPLSYCLLAGAIASIALCVWCYQIFSASPTVAKNSLRTISAIEDLEWLPDATPTVQRTRGEPIEVKETLLIPRKADSGIVLAPRNARAITALQARRAAEAQSHAWAPDSELIFVKQGDIFVSSTTADVVQTATWVFVYRSATNWLAVIVGSTGVLDAGIGSIGKEALAGKLPPIRNWQIDNTAVKKPVGGRLLLASTSSTDLSLKAPIAIWANPSNPWWGVNASTGDEVPARSLLQELEKGDPFFTNIN